jgi:hypothetical protein
MQPCLPDYIRFAIVFHTLLILHVSCVLFISSTGSASGVKRRRPNGSSLREDAPVEVVDGAMLNLHAPGHNALHVFVEGQPQVITQCTTLLHNF